MLDLNSLRSQWSLLKQDLPAAELKHQQELIDEAHKEAEDVLLGRMPVARARVPELAMVKTAMGDAPLLLNTTALTGPNAIVDQLGQIWGTGRYEQLDLGWATSVIYYNQYKNKKGSFGGNAQIIPIPNNTKIAIAGDWGTGYWQGAATPSAKVAAQMLATNPDYTIHIGDTYYNGTQNEMNDNLKSIWPQGKAGTFAIPGNHEMYCGNNFYNAILPGLCPLQNGVSYFALQNDNWLIINLDSSYFANGDYYNNGSIIDPATAGGPQVVWLLKVLEQAGARKIIIVTHHQPVDLTGRYTNNLFSEINTMMMIKNTKPAFWYFGHEHNAAVYNTTSAMRYPSRCVGHGAIPYASATELNGSVGSTVTWAETKSAGDSTSPYRILNGFLSMTLSGASMTETFISENGETRWTQTN